MGMLFGGWAKEEEEEYQAEFQKSGISWKDWKAHKEAKYNNCNLSYYNIIGRFKGIDLAKGDRICKNPNEEQYVIDDFMENGKPICTLVTIEKHDFFKKPYPHETLFVIKNALHED
jgi:hypothetical protein